MEIAASPFAYAYRIRIHDNTYHRLYSFFHILNNNYHTCYMEQLVVPLVWLSFT